MCRYYRYDNDLIKCVEEFIDELLHDICRGFKITCRKIHRFDRTGEFCLEPCASIEFKEDIVTLEIELPGVDKDRIKLWLSEDKERLYLEALGDKRKYCATYRLPYKTELDNIDAEFRNGLLVVKIKKIRAGYEIKIK